MDAVNGVGLQYVGRKAVGTQAKCMKWWPEAKWFFKANKVKYPYQTQ